MNSVCVPRSTLCVTLPLNRAQVLQFRYGTPLSSVGIGRPSSLSTSRPLCIPKCLMVSNEQLSSNALNVNRPLSLMSAQV